MHKNESKMFFYPDSMDEEWQKIQQKLMMQDPEKHKGKDAKKMERQLLEQEVAAEASENSKIRALLHAFNMIRTNPKDVHFTKLYQTAKEKVCQNDNCKR
jgi:hypothetical protein